MSSAPASRPSKETQTQFVERLRRDVRTPITAMVALLRQIRGRAGIGHEFGTLEVTAERALAALDGLLTTRGDDRGSQPGAADRDFLARVRAAIDENLAHPDFRVEALARHLGLSRSLLYRRFEALGGPAPAQMILERRLDKAAEMLRSGSTAVADVADAVGFRAPAHFSDCFRKRFSVCPTAYRRTDRAIGTNPNAKWTDSIPAGQSSC